MNYIDYSSERTKKDEIMKGVTNLIDYNKPVPRSSKMVAAYRWFQVVIVILFVGGLVYRGLI